MMITKSTEFHCFKAQPVWVLCLKMLCFFAVLRALGYRHFPALHLGVLEVVSQQSHRWVQGLFYSLKQQSGFLFRFEPERGRVWPLIQFHGSRGCGSSPFVSIRGRFHNIGGLLVLVYRDRLRTITIEPPFCCKRVIHANCKLFQFMLFTPDFPLISGQVEETPDSMLFYTYLPNEPLSKERVEAFSDGVYAIVATLLILDIWLVALYFPIWIEPGMAFSKWNVNSV